MPSLFMCGYLPNGDLSAIIFFGSFVVFSVFKILLLS